MSANPWPEFLGSQVPRIRVVPAGVEHPRWSEIVEFIARLGVLLDPWQLEVLRVSLMRTVDLARWAAFAVAVCAPRQNGKNAILEMRELVGAYLLGEKLVIHSAHLADTSKEGFRRLDDLIDANEWLSKDVKHIWRTNGHEAIEFRNGNRIRFRTRTRGGGRGFAASPVIFDEAMYLPQVSMDSILPVISAQPDPQVWYMGSAVDQTTMEDGVVFARVRDRALSGDSERLFYSEWSLDADSPELVEVELPRDMQLLAEANPALGIRIAAEYLLAEWREMDPRGHAVERGGVGDWPPVDGSAAQLIPLEQWDALAIPIDADAVLQEPICLAYDIAPDRSMAAVAVAGRNAAGELQLEIVEHKRGTSWIPERFRELIERHAPAWAGCDAYAMLADLENENVEAVNTQEHGLACLRFFDAVQDRTFRHLGSEELRAAVRAARTRPLGDAAWAWSRKGSPVDITPLVAATLALSAAMDQPEPGDPVIW